MNIFKLSDCPREAAKQHADKHVLSQLKESGQMLSTAHRFLDGKMKIVRAINKKGKEYNKKIWIHPDPKLDSALYKVAHLNHPSTVWTRECAANYHWHYQLFTALCDEYSYRYGKIHKSDTLLRSILANHPASILGLPTDAKTQFALAMKSEPQCMDYTDPVGSYRKFYMTKQKRMKMVWTKREQPEWFIRDENR